jgi:hypothetical protein
MAFPAFSTSCPTPCIVLAQPETPAAVRININKNKAFRIKNFLLFDSTGKYQLPLALIFTRYADDLQMI